MADHFNFLHRAKLFDAKGTVVVGLESGRGTKTYATKHLGQRQRKRQQSAILGLAGENMAGRHWLYIHCNACDYYHALWKLGVPR